MKRLFCCLYLCVSVSLTFAQKHSNKEVLAAAKAFLGTLEAEKLKKALFPYDSSERRNWFFTPVSRNGLPLMEMSDTQKTAALGLLKATVSTNTNETAIGIMQLEIILKQIEKLPPNDHRRHPEKFYFSIFGTPDPQKRWGWRIEGHHISLNFSSETGKIHSGTPLFLGSNPAIVPSGYPEAGKQLLKQEETIALLLLHSLSPEQLQKAVVSDKPPFDIFSSNTAHFNDVNALKNGISFGELTKEQQHHLMRLISVYVQRYPFGFADEFMNKIEKAGLHQLVFTWMGAREAKIGNGGHYYRIQNPVLLIEYDNTQTNANHIHTVVRDLTNDFGEDVLRNHYQKEHKAKE